jgi:hypothetical protein
MKLINLLTILNQLKVFHWQTRSFAEHEAFGKTYDALNELIDEFIEVYQGKYGRMFPVGDEFQVNLINYLPDRIDNVMNNIVSYLTNELLNSNDYSADRNSELLNIRDEMLANVNKLRYLLTLK